MTKRKSTAAKKPAAEADAPAKKPVAKKQPAAPKLAETLAEHFAARPQPGDKDYEVNLLKWRAHGRVLAAKEGVRFGRH